MPTWLNALNCCHAIGWLDICETLNGYMCHLCHVVTNKREKNKNLGLELKMKKDKKWPEQTGHRWRLWHQSKEREWGGVVVQRQASGSGFSHQHQSCNICLLVSLWYCASLSGCSRSLPCSSCSVCMCGFKSVKCIYFSNAASYRVSIRPYMCGCAAPSVSLPHRPSQRSSLIRVIGRCSEPSMFSAN